MYRSDRIPVRGPPAIGRYRASPHAGTRRRSPARRRGIVLPRGKATPSVHAVHTARYQVPYRTEINSVCRYGPV
ncbi:hypothetical protein B296_00054289 [Ensete ventricosum]|uniref:Uncharacterized protein n=1 Tax=Ensete ventricosum TaxID=4639 RepID=A0A426Y4S1_ENSVE|nr:hypothetical protein B296_00054289 [Ensete ventricosum]